MVKGLVCSDITYSIMFELKFSHQCPLQYTPEKEIVEYRLTAQCRAYAVLPISVAI